MVFVVVFSLHTDAADRWSIVTKLAEASVVTLILYKKKKRKKKKKVPILWWYWLMWLVWTILSMSHSQLLVLSVQTSADSFRSFHIKRLAFSKKKQNKNNNICPNFFPLLLNDCDIIRKRKIYVAWIRLCTFWNTLRNYLLEIIQISWCILLYVYSKRWAV